MGGAMGGAILQQGVIVLLWLLFVYIIFDCHVELT